MIKQSQVHGDWIDEIIEKYADMVFRVAYTHTKNRADSDDVFQEVFTKLFRSAAVFESDEHIKAWLIRVTTNTSLDLLKSAWSRKTVELPEELPATEQNEFYEGALTQAVKSLPPKYRTVIHLFYYHEMSITEIAKVLKSREGTVKSQLSRARELLKNKLNGGTINV